MGDDILGTLEAIDQINELLGLGPGFLLGPWLLVKLSPGLSLPIYPGAGDDSTPVLGGYTPFYFMMVPITGHELLDLSLYIKKTLHNGSLMIEEVMAARLFTLYKFFKSLKLIAHAIIIARLGGKSNGQFLFLLGKLLVQTLKQGDIFLHSDIYNRQVLGEILVMVKCIYNSQAQGTEELDIVG